MKIGKASINTHLTLICSLLILLCLPGFSWALQAKPNATPQTVLFQQANQWYEKGQYNKAAAIYTQISASGYENGNLYYNLGNVYCKQGYRGLAILNYEKARRFLPFDHDLQNNLNLALQGVNEGEINWGHVFYSTLTHLAPLNWLTVGSSVCFFIFILLLIVMILFPSRVKKADSGHVILGYKITCILVGCFLFCFAALTVLSFLDQHQEQAVAIKGNAPVINEPKPEGTIYFNLDEGTRVRINSVQGNWYLIKRQDGKRGWVENQYLEKI
jgi:tetratricopeptide (TPR) repeat protein